MKVTKSEVVNEGSKDGKETFNTKTTTKLATIYHKSGTVAI